MRSKRRREPSGSRIISLLKYGLGLHPSLSKTPLQPNGNHITRMLPPPRFARHLPPGGRQSYHPRPTDKPQIHCRWRRIALASVRTPRLSKPRQTENLSSSPYAKFFARFFSKKRIPVPQNRISVPKNRPLPSKSRLVRLFIVILYKKTMSNL